MGFKTTLAAVALLAACVSTPALAAERFKVSAELSHQGRAFAAPALVVEAGKTALTRVAGDDGYSLAITVTPLEDGSLKVSSDLRTAHGETAPVLVMQPGKPATVKVGEIGMSLTVARSGS